MSGWKINFTDNKFKALFIITLVLSGGLAAGWLTYALLTLPRSTPVQCESYCMKTTLEFTNVNDWAIMNDPDVKNATIDQIGIIITFMLDGREMTLYDFEQFVLSNYSIGAGVTQIWIRPQQSNVSLFESTFFYLPGNSIILPYLWLHVGFNNGTIRTYRVELFSQLIMTPTIDFANTTDFYNSLYTPCGSEISFTYTDVAFTGITDRISTNISFSLVR